MESIFDFMKLRYKPECPFSIVNIDYDELAGKVKISVNLNGNQKLIQKNPNRQLLKLTNKSDASLVILKNDTIVDPRNTKYEKVYVDKNKSAKLGKGMRWEV